MTTTKTHTVAIVLGRRGIDSKVLIDGVDITTALTALQVRASVDELLTTVVLTLATRVELTGDVEQLLRTTPLFDLATGELL